SGSRRDLRSVPTRRSSDLKLELDRLAEGRKRFTGVLAGVEDGKVAIDLKGEDETALIPFEWIADAKLVMSDALIEESLRRSKHSDRKSTRLNSSHVKISYA